MDKLTIVSTDGHAGPLVEAYRPYLEKRYHDALDKLVEEEREFLDATSKIGSFSEAQLAVIDPEGRIVARLGLGIEGVLDASLPTAIPPTVYARFGDVPAATIVFAALLLVIRRRISRRTS